MRRHPGVHMLAAIGLLIAGPTFVGAGGAAAHEPWHCYECAPQGEIGCQCQTGAYSGFTECVAVYPGGSPCYCLGSGRGCGQALLDAKFGLDGTLYALDSTAASTRVCSGILLVSRAGAVPGHPIPLRYVL